MSPYRTAPTLIARRPKHAPLWCIAWAWICGTFRKNARRRSMRRMAVFTRTIVDRIMPMYPDADRALVGQIVRSGVVVQVDPTRVYVRAASGRVHNFHLDEAAYKVLIEPMEPF